MVQLWMESEETAEGQPDPVDVVPEGPMPPGFLHVLDATGGRDEPVMLVHEDSEPLRRMAVFDLVTNNTDRKGGHVLPMPDGHRYGVDHGVCFHTEDKLRTVLWGWAGAAPLAARRPPGVECVLDGLDGDLREQLEDLLTVREVDAVDRRCERLLRTRRLPGAARAAGPRSRGRRSEGRPIGSRRMRAWTSPDVGTSPSRRRARTGGPGLRQLHAGRCAT